MKSEIDMNYFVFACGDNFLDIHYSQDNSIFEIELVDEIEYATAYMEDEIKEWLECINQEYIEYDNSEGELKRIGIEWGWCGERANKKDVVRIVKVTGMLQLKYFKNGE